MNVLLNMKIFTTVLFSIIALSCSLCHAEEEAVLSDYVGNLMHTHDLAVACAGGQNAKTHVPVYIRKLTLKADRPRLTRQTRYALARHLLDCHHLCQAFYHQTYILGEGLPIFDLLEEAFPGFTAATKQEGGVWIRGIYEFLENRDPFTGELKNLK